MIHTQLKAEATDPEGSSLTYKWSGEGTIASKDLNPMIWTAPNSEGIYKVTVEVSDDKGVVATFTADVYVHPKAAAVAEPPKVASIIYIQITGSNNGKYYKNEVYLISVSIDDPLNMVMGYFYGINGVAFERVTTDWYSFRSPDIAGDLAIIVSIEDKDGNTLNKKTKTIYIEP